MCGHCGADNDSVYCYTCRQYTCGCVKICDNCHPSGRSVEICPTVALRCYICDRDFCEECGSFCTRCEQTVCYNCAEECGCCLQFSCYACMVFCRNTCSECSPCRCLDCKYAFVEVRSDWERVYKERLLLLEKLNPKYYDYDEAINLIFKNTLT